MTEDYNLYPMYVFRLVAEMGSVTRAAQYLSISQPAVSAHIRTMERRCGEQLLERTPRGVGLTPAGEVVVKMSNRIFSLYRDLPKAVDDSLGKVRGDVVLAASSTPGSWLAPEILKRFILKFPEVKPVLMVGDSSEVLEMINNYTAPIGFIGDIKQTNSLDRHRIGTDTIQLVTSAGNPLSELPRIKGSDIKATTLLIREQGSSTREAALGMLKDLVNSFDRTLEIPNTDAIKNAVINDLGIAVLSNWSIKLEEQASLLKSVKDDRFKRARPIFAVKRKDRQLMGPALALWKFLQEEESKK